jgi:cytochrome c peroxidase
MLIPLVLVLSLRTAPPLGLDLYRPVPESNPLTPEKIALGRRLFFDKQLSRDGTVACATCHNPKRAFTNSRKIAVGIEGQKGSRNVPTLVNRVYGKSFFLDGRAPTLEKQAIEPILNPIEMGLTLAEIKTRTGLEPPQVTDAIASYVRTILDGNSPYDRYVNGDSNALSAKQKLGLAVFRGKGRCTTCHAGPNLTDEQFHNTGIAWRDGALQDPGRFKVTGKPEDHGAFKVPTLREVARTAPYMHDGSLATLKDVVEYYNRGGNQNPWLDPDIHPLRLTSKEKRALVSFLKSLSGTIQEGRF